MAATPEQGLHAWIEYLRDMGVYDLYRREAGSVALPEAVLERLRQVATAAPRQGMPPVRSSQPSARPAPGTVAPGGPPSASRPPVPPPQRVPQETARRSPLSAAGGRPQAQEPVAARVPPPPSASSAEPERSYFNTDEELQKLPPELAAPMPKPNPLESLLPMPAAAVPPGDRQAALAQLQAEIGDCTRCPLAYAGRHTIVFGEGDPNAELMFVGEGPGADEDAIGRPFVGKAGQLLNNMISAMGLQREQVFIANIVKCRPPGNRAPEFVEATTCSQFLLRQIDIVRPKIIVALGSTAATYVLGVRQSLSGLRGQWFSSRGAKVAVTYHPAFLLRDPRQKAEAWKDLQRVMADLGLRPPAKA